MILVRRSNSRKEKEEADEAADLMNMRYHECVEEIKLENAAMGSLQLHNEAMRRLKERQEGNKEFAPDKVQPRKNRRVSDRFRFTRSFQSTVDTLRRGSGGGPNKGALGESERSGNSGPMLEATIVPGRRTSALPDSLEHDVILSSPMFQDIELSDSESEHDEDEASSPPASRGDSAGGSAGRRRSIIRRTSSLIGSRIRSRRSSTTRRSSQSSISSGGVSDKSHGHKKEDEKVDEEKTCPGPGSADELKDRRRSSAESSGDDEGEKTASQVHGKATRRSSTVRARRSGKRRSSLFSVDERRASLTTGTKVEQSSLGDSIGNSMTEGSLKGSTSGGYRRGSLICNFRRKSSFSSSLGSNEGDDDSLICGWERRQSVLSNSVVSIQDEILEGGEEKKCSDGGNNESLICGWDPQQSAVSQLSLAEDELLKQNDSHVTGDQAKNDKSNGSLICGWNQSSKSILSKEDEKVLLQAKESCALFDVRKEKDRVIAGILSEIKQEI